MQIQIFNIPVPASQDETDELNKFLRSHTIIDVEKQLISTGSNAWWTFCIRYLEGDNSTNHIKQERKIDYREVLDESDFKKYSLLRNCRKKIADENGLPLYAVFTNEELADIARLPEISIGKIKSINGIGTKKCEKYGIPLLELYNAELQ
jgi:superfamily II DNA helicase RecQ